MNDTTPTTEELTQFSLRAFKGIEAGLGQADPVATIAQKLEALHPGHLILVQAGKFLHGYDRTAYALSILKKYRLKLVGTATDPHIRVGFPAGNFKRRLWAVVEEFGIPYAVALGTQATGHTVYVSSQPTSNNAVLESVSPQVIADVINDLRQRGELNKAAAKLLLTAPDTACFQLKAKAQDMDTQILQDILKMPRDLRTTYGENLRSCIGRILRGVMAYGLEDNKPQLLKALSADVDMLKHYLAQAPRLNGLKLAFESRAGLAVELGRLVGGLIRLQGGTAMINEGDSLKGLAMRSSGAATGIPSRMPASSISTTTGPTTATTMSASADPRNNSLDAGHAHGRTTLGRASPGASAPKARHHAQPETAALPTGGAVGCGTSQHKLTK